MEETMTRIELLILLLSIQALLESGNADKTLELLTKVIDVARNG